jgi:prevent-host-death family protein
MTLSAQQIPAGEFKAKCLHIMDEVKKQHSSIIITKHGSPVAKLVPVEKKPTQLFGYLKNSVTIIGDIISPVDEKWEADE